MKRLITSLSMLIGLTACGGHTSSTVQDASSTVTPVDGENTDVQVLSAAIGDEIQGDENGCHNVEIRLVMRQGAYTSQVLGEVGFYTTFAIEGQTTPAFAKDALASHVTGSAKLQSDGSDAVILTFHGIGYCFAGDLTSSEDQTLEFKPYALYSYQDASGQHAARQWAVGQNSWLGGDPTNPDQHQRTEFDMSSQLLAN